MRTDMSKEVAILAVIVIILAVIGISVLLLLMPGNPGPNPKACPADAKICPGGGAVGRVLPGCEFAACPAVMNNTPQGCTKDAKVCPDGTSVGRVLPDCYFAECPKGSCGDGSCLDNETCLSCPGDCRCPNGYYCNPNDLSSSMSGGCTARNPAECDFDQTCDSSENCSDCAFDCGQCPIVSDPCDRWVGLDKKAECYSLLAQNESDAGICERITAVNFKDDCYKAYATVKADMPACEHLEGRAKLDCIKYVAIGGRNYTKCLEIPDKFEYNTIRYDCLAAFAKNTLDNEPCKLIGNIIESQSCTEAVSLKLNNLEGCLLLKEAGVGDQYGCFLREANKSKDASICENLAEDQYMVQCIYHVIKDNELMDNRCTGLSLDSEYLCRAIADEDYTLCEHITDADIKERCNELWPCVDSDGGRKYYDEGEVLLLGSDGKRSRHPDSCGGIGENGAMTILEEYYCTSSGGMAWETFICPGECEDGECKK